MIDYNSAKKLVSYFTNINDTTAFVEVSYDIKRDIGKNAIPEMPEVSLITIDYGPNGIVTKMFARLEIDMRLEDSVNDDDVVCGKRVGFHLSTYAEENGDHEHEQICANLVEELAKRIAQAMDWGWRYDR